MKVAGPSFWTGSVGPNDRFWRKADIGLTKAQRLILTQRGHRQGRSQPARHWACYANENINQNSAVAPEDCGWQR